MAFAVGKCGVSSLTSLGSLILLFYATSIIFVVVVLGSLMGLLLRLRYLKEELLIILGTSTAEPALPGLIRKLEFAGVKKETVGLVVHTGYSFNLDGAAIWWPSTSSGSVTVSTLPLLPCFSLCVLWFLSRFSR